MLDNDISPRQQKCLESAFEATDKNGNSILSADEYYEIFQNQGLSIGKNTLHLSTKTWIENVIKAKKPSENDKHFMSFSCMKQLDYGLHS